MARGYQIDQLKEQLVDLLHNSKTGFSGVEISEKLGINRVTMTKYLGIFAAEGLINRKNIGNVTLWFIDDDVEQFNFPDDYFAVQKKYSEFLIAFSHKQLFTLICNCVHSGANASKIITEVIIPSISTINDLFDDGKIGTAEENLLRNIVSESIKILDVVPHNENSAKNVIILSADSDSQLISDTSSALYRSKNWTVFPLGNMASTADVLFDLDLQKLLSKIWKKKTGIMLILVLSNSKEGFYFFADSINTIKQKLAKKKLFLVLCGPIDKKTKLDADLMSPDLETILQWSETVFESHVNN